MKVNSYLYATEYTHFFFLLSLFIQFLSKRKQYFILNGPLMLRGEEVKKIKL